MKKVEGKFNLYYLYIVFCYTLLVRSIMGGGDRLGQDSRKKLSCCGAMMPIPFQRRKIVNNIDNEFDTFFSEIYGEKRWPVLRGALSQEALKVALYNRFCQLPFASVTAGLARLHPSDLTQTFVPDEVCHLFFLNGVEGPNHHHQVPEHNDAVVEDKKKKVNEWRRTEVKSGAPVSYYLPPPPLDDFHIRGYYLLDYASALVVEQLHVTPFDRVLDLCAAPGGKSVAIAQFLSPDGHLTANETLPDRCARLRRNLNDHIPTTFVPWVVTQRNGSTWHEPCRYTRVLVDAPCSSERHVLFQARKGGGKGKGRRAGDDEEHDAGGRIVDWTERRIRRGSGGSNYLHDWRRNTTKEISRSQVALLRRGVEACCEGGRVVYSTCSISPFENDMVVAELLRTTRCVVKPVLPAPSAAITSGVSTPAKGGADEWDSHEPEDEEWEENSNNNNSSEKEMLRNKRPNGEHRHREATWIPHASKASSETFTLPPIGRPTEYGWLILPDTADGWGPIYFAVLYKVHHERPVHSSSDDTESDPDMTE